MKLFNEKLDNIFDIVHKEKKYCYIICDFNVNCIKDFSNVTVHSQQFNNMFLLHYYLKLITIPTRVTQSSTTLLDNIYTTDPMSGKNGVLTSDFSDHDSIITIRQNMEPRIPDKYRYKREFTNKDISKLNKRFNKIDWNSTLNTNSVLLDSTCLFTLFKDIFDSCFHSSIL